MKPYLKKTLIAWVIAGGLGLLMNLIWLYVVCKGDFSGYAIFVVYIFLIGFAIAHLVIFLPLFIFCLRKPDFWITKFRYLIPLGFTIGALSPITIKGSSNDLLKASLLLGGYGVMLAFSYVVSLKWANKELSQIIPLPKHDVFVGED